MYRLALTGTPIAQGIEDAWAIYDYLDRIFGPWDDTWEGGLDGVLIPGFESKYLVYGGFKKKQIVGYQNQEDFYEVFHKYSFRITLREAKQEGGKGQMILRYQKRYFDLNPVARDVYDPLQGELETIVNEKKIRVPNVLSCVSKLQQIAGGFLLKGPLLEDILKRVSRSTIRKVHRIGGKGKMDLLLEIIPKIEGKFVVICRFIHELEACQKALRRKGYAVAIVRGGMPYDHKFKHDAICMQIQSGMAVDMSLADYCGIL